MSFAKTHLKAARDGLTKKDYQTAKTEAALVLDFEPENYNAHVFLALALLELGEFDKSEQAYRKAIELNPNQPLAYQGLCSFYERRQDWGKQVEALDGLMLLFKNLKEPVKCAETLQKLVALRRTHGTRIELIESLSYYLPGSSVYSVLSKLPQPDPTNPTSTTTFESQDAIHNGFRILEEITSLTEVVEEDTFKREVEKRRMRLGAPSPEQLRNEVFIEIFSKSQLPTLYESILKHPSTSDELRQVTESKQLRNKQKYLHSIPATKDQLPLKQRVSSEIDDLVDGIILLHKRDELGWNIFFESKDCEDMSGYDHSHVQEYISLFPDSALASLFKGYFSYKRESLSDDSDDNIDASSDEDPMDIILTASTSLSDTIIANRILGEVHLSEGDYENAIKASKRGLQHLSQLESATGKTLSRTRTGLQVILASSLVHFFPPKHHPESTRIINEILQRSPRNTAALMSRASILQATSNWEEAAGVFEEVSSLLPDDVNVGLRAREECAWCRCQLGLIEECLVELQLVLDVLNELDSEELNHDRARCLWRIGKCYLEIGGSGIESAYKHFISALKKDSEFAPAFTSLGLYYLQNASPPDPIRSSKCFQKAFELDPRETVAARRLAEGFANDREWDLVEVVAQRTIDGEGGLNAGMDKAEIDATRYLPTNSWAWKAIGVVKSHYKDFPAAIQAFQISLRVEPDDQGLWVRLGEAYNKAGRQVAALKSLNHALEMKPDDWLCSYFIAEVKRSMGLFEESITILDSLRKIRPDEAGILSLLGQAHLDLGVSQISDGFQVRAEETFLKAIQVALYMIEHTPGFRTIAWKIIGDAAFQLSCFSAFVNGASVRHTLQAISFPPFQDTAEDITQIVPTPTFQKEAPLEIIAVAIYSCLAQISLYSLSQTSNSGAWYDLSVALLSWIRRAPPSADISPVKEKVVEYLKKALQLDPSSDIYWVGLGNAYFLSHAKAAQHAYIKALELDSKNPSTWVKLGLLYLYHGDVELANEAMYRAQVLDPDNTLAWVGQFLIATMNQDTSDASLLLEHAVGLPTPVPEADYEFSTKVFASSKQIQRSDTVQDTLLPAFFLLNRYIRRQPNDTSGLHLLSLVCERLGHLSFGAEVVERAIGILESAYEETEDPEVERKYTIANVTLGRLRLSQGEYSESVMLFESALGLLAEKDEEDRSSQVLKVQAHLGLGLAHFLQGSLEAALGFLEDGLTCAGEDLLLSGHITIVLAQTLWAIGTEEAQETAKSRLLECIASDPENLTAINTLAGMGILTNDDGLVDAALSEILALPIEQKNKLDPQRHVDYLLIQHHLAQGDVKQAISIAQHSVFSDPSNLGARNRLASLNVQQGQNNEALALLAHGISTAGRFEVDIEAATVASSIRAVAQAASSPLLEAEDNKAHVEAGMLRDALRNAQRAIMNRPSEARGWQTLAFVRSCMV